MMNDELVAAGMAAPLIQSGGEDLTRAAFEAESKQPAAGAAQTLTESHGTPPANAAPAWVNLEEPFWEERPVPLRLITF